MDRNEYFMRIARTVSLRSSCVRRQVGAILVREDMIVSTGYNGTPKGLTNCNEGGCPRCNMDDIPSGEDLEDCICVHAEQNAIVQAAFNGISTDGTRLYTTLAPCTTCTKLIINAGVIAVFVHDPHYAGADATDMLKRAKISFSAISFLL